MIQNVSYIRPSALATLLRMQHDLPVVDRRIAVVDVRDDDHVGGHIAQSLHIPAATFMSNVDSYAREISQSNDVVVFHCAFSQVRGPKCARMFAQALARNSEQLTSDTGSSRNPEVKVLEGGFAEFAKLYDQHSNLFTDFDRQFYDTELGNR